VSLIKISVMKIFLMVKFFLTTIQVMSLISKALLLDSHDRLRFPPLRVCISEMSIVFDNILYKI